ncbi:hypothetical protein AAZX31_13G009200 [Glycine max]
MAFNIICTIKTTMLQSPHYTNLIYLNKRTAKHPTCQFPNFWLILNSFSFESVVLSFQSTIHLILTFSCMTTTISCFLFKIHKFHFLFLVELPTYTTSTPLTYLSTLPKPIRSHRQARKLLDLLMFNNLTSFLHFHLVNSTSPLGNHRCACSASSSSDIVSYSSPLANHQRDLCG